jgi:hypothetical protein
MIGFQNNANIVFIVSNKCFGSFNCDFTHISKDSQNMSNNEVAHKFFRRGHFRFILETCN